MHKEVLLSHESPNKEFLSQMLVIKCPLGVPRPTGLSNPSILGLNYQIKFTCHCSRTKHGGHLTMSYSAVSTEPSNGWPIDVAPSASFEDFEALEMEEPNPLRAQPTSTPHLMLQSHVSTNTGVLINTLRTANKSGYLEGGVIINSNPCRPKIATYTTCIFLKLKKKRLPKLMRNSRWKEAG